jgi:hypothetical protein
MNKIVKISVILPGYEARYVVGEQIQIKTNSGNTLNKAFEDDVVKKIVRTQIAYDTYGYDIITLSGLILEIKEDQPGLQIITQEEVNENN